MLLKLGEEFWQLAVCEENKYMENVRLGDYIQEYTVRNKKEEDIPVYSVTNTQGFCRDYFGKEVASKNKSTYKIVPKGFFAYNPSRINVGSVDWQRIEDKVLVSPLYNVFSVSEKVYQQYLYYYLKSDKILHYIKEFATGSVRDNLKLSILYEFPICLPEVDRQKEIACLLDKVQEIIQIYKKQLKKLDELVKSRFIELFGDPLHPVHSRALGDVAMLERGRFSPRPRNDPRYYGGDYPFIQTGDIAGCGHRLSEYRQTLNEKGIHVSKKFSAGTIVIAIVGATIGATAILEIDVYAPDSVIGISVNDELYNNVFMEALLQFWQPELVRIAPESARANINLSILQSIPIIDVELPRQLQFAAFVAQIDKSKLLELKQYIN